MAALALPFAVYSLPDLFFRSNTPQSLPSLLRTKPSNGLHETLSQKPSTTSLLLDLPAEIRLQIYGLALAQSSCFRHSHTRPPHPGTALALLRVNRSIYDEARLIPFQRSQIEFQKWYGSSMFCCITFLKTIEDWQRREIRTLDITVNGRELDGWQAREGWHPVCELLKTERSAPVGLRSMTLKINGTRGFSWGNVLKTDAAWVCGGLRKVTSLRSLLIVLGDAEIEEELVLRFEQTLRIQSPFAIVQKEAAPVETKVEESRTYLWNL
ncbi:hypothetical protein MMC13_000428 [Lambiella insularis]|nr:hypothetical protein [Lambiella insularis]